MRSRHLLTVGFWIACLAFIATDARAQGEQREIVVDASFTTKLDWFDAAACAKGSSKNFHFLIGKQIFRIDRNNVARGILRSFQTNLGPKSQRTVRVSKTAGCANDPLPLAQVELLVSNSKFAKYVVLSESAPRTNNGPAVALYIQHLSKNGSCKSSAVPGVTACSGSRTFDGRRVNITFMVVMDDGNKVHLPESGIPIHARCEDLLGPIVCTVSEEMKNDVTVKAVIDQKSISAAKIRDLREKLMAYATALNKP